MSTTGTLWRTAVILLLAISGAVAAFATMAPPPEAQLLPERAALVEALPIDTDDALVPSPASYIREEQFQRGDTLAAFLSRLGIAEPHAGRLIKLNALRSLRPGMNVSAVVSAEGMPLSLSFFNGRDALLEITPDGRVAERRAAFETRLAMKSSVIRSSLFAAADAAEIPDSVAMQLADVFSGDIDFHRDLRKDDRFTVVYEVHSLLGRPVRAGRVLAAEFVNQGRTFRAVHFGSSYYTPEGKNLRKAFLRSPLEFSRVSSGFGRRLHPLFRTWRAHEGIDYAAPTGTRVRAVGDAVVEFAGLKGGYGKVVILRHQGRYTTVYAHLSRIAVQRGARVAQNDTIGFVGQSGWATGPHLHYEFRIAGQARNPFSLAMPAAQPLPAQQLPAFLTHAEPLVARLELLADLTTLAQGD
ncbi:MAG: M23 family metallopeptidase [Betaproteobacteria bacterium]|nr:M23 family metallopeptidase [Betaproteobacteria bacterium]